MWKNLLGMAIVVVFVFSIRWFYRRNLLRARMRNYLNEGTILFIETGDTDELITIIRGRTYLGRVVSVGFWGMDLDILGSHTARLSSVTYSRIIELRAVDGLDVMLGGFD